MNCYINTLTHHEATLKDLGPSLPLKAAHCQEKEKRQILYLILKICFMILIFFNSEDMETAFAGEACRILGGGRS